MSREWGWWFVYLCQGVCLFVAETYFWTDGHRLKPAIFFYEFDDNDHFNDIAIPLFPNSPLSKNQTMGSGSVLADKQDDHLYPPNPQLQRFQYQPPPPPKMSKPKRYVAPEALAAFRLLLACARRNLQHVSVSLHALVHPKSSCAMPRRMLTSSILSPSMR